MPLVRGQTAESRAIDPDVDVVLEGDLISAEEWEARQLYGGEIVTLKAGARGGGFLRTVLTLAVLAAAIFIPGAIGLTGIAASLVGAGISIAGGLIVNALFPIRPPELGGPDNRQAEPVYSLSGGSNRARLYEPLPLVLGTHRVFPDIAAQEYTENEGREQFLNQIFHFGLGDLDISDIRIGATPIGDFTGVTQEISRGDAIALVAGNVDTTAGAALTEAAAGIVRRTGADTRKIGLDFTGRIFKLTDRGKYVAHTVVVDVKWWKAGAGEPASVQRTITHEHDDQSPYRGTWTIDLGEAATWNVKVNRREDPSDEERTYDELVWSALRSYQPDTGDYTGQTRLAVRIQASGQLSGRLDRVSALVKQKLPVPVPDDMGWGGAKFVTSNPAALFRAYARGFTIGTIGTRAGVGLADARIDHDGLAAWYAWCQTNGYTCDIAIQGGMTHDAVLNLIAQCGRASVSWQSGKLGVVFEDANHVPAGLVTPGNVVKGTFRVEYAPGDLADEVVVRYIEPDLDWQYNSVRRTRPGLVGTPQKTATVTAKGIAKRDNAAIECNLQVARQFYHKRRLIWEMGREGLVYTKGSVVWITHSLIDGGEAGRLSAIESGTDLRLDREVEIDADSWLLLRMPDGTVHQSRVAARGASPTRNVRVAAAISGNDRDGAAVDALWRLYDNALPPVKARIIAVEPLNDRRFRLTAIDEVAAYHTLATSDLTAPFPGFRTRFPTVVAVQFAARRVQAGNVNVVELRAHLTVAGPWGGAVVRAGRTAAALATVDTLTGGDLEAKWIVPDDGADQHVEIRPHAVGGLDGRVWTGSWSWDGGLPVSDVTGFAVRELQGGIREFSWTPPESADTAGVVIRFAAVPDDPAAAVAWDAMTALIQGRLGASPFETLLPAAGTWRFTARVENTSGELSPGVTIDATLGEVDVTGADGEEGVGVEYVFASSVNGAAITGAANLPDPDWNYDIPALRTAAGATRGTQKYYDGLPPDLSSVRPYYIRFQREVPGAPAVNEDVGTRAWLQGPSVYAVGQDGEDGVDGAGVEYIYASSADGATITGAANLPDPDWNFDIPALATANGVTRGTRKYYDGLPPDLGAARRYYIRFRRTVPGTPAQNADIGTRAWTQDKAIKAVSEDGATYEYIFASSADGAAITGAANLPDPDWNFNAVSAAGTARGTQTYYDGLPTDIGEDRPYYIRFRRLVHGIPASGADVGTRNWIQERAINGAGLQGVDGRGVEYVFASSTSAAAITGAANLPDPDWNFDIPGLASAGGVQRGNQRYYDGTPPNLSLDRPFYIRFRRSVPGSPSADQDIGSSSWTQEPAVRGRGLDGEDGTDGDDGTDGTDGVSIRSVTRASNGTVTVRYSNGNTDTFTVRDGTDGTNITSTFTVNANGSITVTFSDGTSFTIPKGAAGRGISTIVRDSSAGIVTVTYDDGGVATFPLADGQDGRDGINGRDGDPVSRADLVDQVSIQIQWNTGGTSWSNGLPPADTNRASYRVARDHSTITKLPDGPNGETRYKLWLRSQYERYASN